MAHGVLGVLKNPVAALCRDHDPLQFERKAKGKAETNPSNERVSFALDIDHHLADAAAAVVLT